MWQKDGKIYNRGGIIAADGRWHSTPTRKMFIEAGWTWIEPPAPEPEPENPVFSAVKAAFWGYVDEAAAELSEATGDAYSRADFPTGAYSPQLLAWCTEHGLSEEQTGALAVKFCGIDADLRRLGKSWDELFDGTNLSDSEGAPDE